MRKASIVARRQSDVSAITRKGPLDVVREGYKALRHPYSNEADQPMCHFGDIKKEAVAVEANPTATAALLAPNLGLEPKVLEVAERRRKHNALPLTTAITEKQQDIADTFSDLKLIPHPIKVKEAIWIWH